MRRAAGDFAVTVGLVGRPTEFGSLSRALPATLSGGCHADDRGHRSTTADGGGQSATPPRACARPTSPRCPAWRSSPSTARPRATTRGLRADRLAGRVPVHPRALPDRLPRPHLDDPPVRRLRQRPADQRALQDDPRPRRRRAVGGVRHADPDGPRQRRPEGARRGRPLRRRDRHRRRHGRAVRRHPARRRHDVDDDLRPGRAGVLHVPRRRRAPGRPTSAASTARCRPTSSRSTSRRRSGCSRPSRTCA